MFMYIYMSGPTLRDDIGKLPAVDPTLLVGVLVLHGGNDLCSLWKLPADQSQWSCPLSTLHTLDSVRFCNIYMGLMHIHICIYIYGPQLASDWIGLDRIGLDWTTLHTLILTYSVLDSSFLQYMGLTIFTYSVTLIPHFLQHMVCVEAWLPNIFMSRHLHILGGKYRLFGQGVLNRQYVSPPKRLNW